MSAASRDLLRITAGVETVKVLPTQTIITKDELIAVNNYSKSVSFDVSRAPGSVAQQGSVSGVVLISSEIGTGAVKLPSGTLYFFKADPTVAANASALAAAGADHLLVIGVVPVVASDWEGDLSGAVASLLVDVPFPKVGSVFVAFKMDAVSEFNSAGDDEEILDIFISCKAKQ